MRCGCVGVRLRSRTRARPSLPRRMTTHDAASVAEAESFAARLESLAASIPPARPLEAPLVASVPFRDGTTAAHRAAVAFERLVGGEDAPRTTWYSAGKRHLHQPQLEALARLVAPMAESSDDPRDERVVLELGAGQALLGRLVSRITSAPLVAVDRRDTGDAPRSSHDDGHEDEKDDASAPDAESDPPTPKMTRVVVDLTRCAYDELLADANLAPHHLNDADAPPSAVVVAKHLCAGATDAAVRLVVDGATRRPGRAAVASVALAPCCHPQIRRDEYSGAEWLERAWRDAGNRIGAVSSALGPAGFARVLALVGVTKERAGASAETLARYHGKSLGALTEICGGFPRLRRLGRIARRALEHGRAEALRAGGFPDARVCRYVDAATSPDNLVIVAGTPVVAGASSSGACSGARSGADPDATVDGVPARGVVAHVNAADAGARGSLSRRVAEYLLESRGRCLRAGDLPPMESVVAASAWRPAGEATAREKKRRQRQKCAGDARRFARRSERRDGDGHPGGDDLELDDEPVDEIAPTRDPVEESLGESTRVPAVMVGGDPSRILAFLASRGRAHVARSVGMLCPFDRHERARPGETDVASLARVADRVVRLARGDDDGGRGCDGDKNIGDVVVRLAAFPRSLEDALARALDGRVRLSPSTFTHSLCATRWIPDGDDDDPTEGGYLWSFLPVADWDPRDWRARAAVGAGTADVGESTRATRAVETSMGEITERLLPSPFASAPDRALVVTDDGPAMESALARWCVDVAGASRVVVSRPRRGEDGEWSAETVAETTRDEGASPPGPADVCVFRLGRELEDAVRALAAATRRETRDGPALKPGAWIVGPGVKLGRRARRRRAAEEAASALRGAGFICPRVLHMLADRELERTVACRLGDWDAGGDPGRARREGGARADVCSSGGRTRE